jgi:hypothetical protein
VKARYLALVVALAFALSVAAPAAGDSSRGSVTAVAAKTCSSGYTHAVMPDGSHKCLRVGQSARADVRGSGPTTVTASTAS